MWILLVLAYGSHGFYVQPAGEYQTAKACETAAKQVAKLAIKANEGFANRYEPRMTCAKKDE